MTETLEKNYTYLEFLQMDLDEGFLYELLNGQIVHRSAPSLKHQEVLSELNDIVKKYTKENNLGKVYFAPVDVCLDDNNVPQPDLVFVSNKNKKITEGDYINGIPELVVEIISKGSVVRDRVTKKNIYERFGILEYWLIDLENQTIEVYNINKNNQYDLESSAEYSDEKIKSKVLKGLEIKLSELF